MGLDEMSHVVRGGGENDELNAPGWCKADRSLDYLRKSRRWQRLRQQILRAFPVCPVCLRVGCAPRASVDIHHIVPARVMIERAGGDNEAFFELSNLAPVCRRHHERNESAWSNGTAETVFPVSERLTLEKIGG